MNGKVKWFAPTKGYGFILGEDGKDYFCHYTEIQAKGYKTLNREDEVTFEIVKGDRGESASKIVVTKPAPRPSGEKFEH